jgi:hypothetical protein
MALRDDLLVLVVAGSRAGPRALSGNTHAMGEIPAAGSAPSSLRETARPFTRATAAPDEADDPTSVFRYERGEPSRKFPRVRYT